MTAHASDIPMTLDVACHLNVVVADASPESLEQALPALVDLGIHRVVLPPLDPAATDTRSMRDAFAHWEVSPITIAGQAPGADVSSDDADERAAGVDALRQALRLTAELGGDQMNGVPYGLFGSPGAPVPRQRVEEAARLVGQVADEAADLGIAMTFEVLNRYETSVVNTAAQAMRFAEASGSENLRIHLDTFHMAVEESDLEGAIRLALPRLSYLELGQSGRGALSGGAVDIPQIVRQALDDGYRGRFGVEAFSRTVLAEPVADMLAIWRAPYDDGIELMRDALRVIRSGWAASTAGRREIRLARGAMV
ncbi:D-psicose/D-tagatose/L-ribulose 3-epimerase [Microbacterium sp. SLBN-154]|uniref:sugar phosphate isomerase/epimerase family protein n=1 Tax=Microbacterium sp. SLBN-154 TaxID=2768458 RepID=UPI001152DBB8|nr:sugar phosphate isomerase/epimerase family protein [Microbacterium sp. SLBN-154]TQK18526.1 D-psicose/D-tagatose/L-ribulose 3-epimerase [Microbacterium sp. SLBN-154]